MLVKKEGGGPGVNEYASVVKRESEYRSMVKSEPKDKYDPFAKSEGDYDPSMPTEGDSPVKTEVPRKSDTSSDFDGKSMADSKSSNGVSPPENSEMRELIENLAVYIGESGDGLLASLKEENRNKPDFWFLYHTASPEYKYLMSRIKDIRRQADKQEAAWEMDDAAGSSTRTP